jgi:hypothetical protein
LLSHSLSQIPADGSTWLADRSNKDRFIAPASPAAGYQEKPYSNNGLTIHEPVTVAVNCATVNGQVHYEGHNNPGPGQARETLQGIIKYDVGKGSQREEDQAQQGHDTVIEGQRYPLGAQPDEYERQPGSQGNKEA